MNKFIAYILTVISIVIGGISSYAQTFPSGGTYGTWGKFANVIDCWGELELTGDVDMKGVVRIPEGKTLVITSNKDVTIRNAGIARYVEGGIKETSSAGRSRMFTVKGSGGKLVIRAAEGKTITLDGGADFIWDDYNLERGANSRSLSEAIANEGTLELENVVIQDVDGSDNNGGAIDISSSADGPTILNKCKILRCYSQLGSAIMLSGKYPLNITDSEISYCNSGGGPQSNSGGAIRTYGNVSADLNLTRVKFFYNYAQRNSGYNNTLLKDGNGGALFWNARGTDETKCTINGCEFAYNKSGDNGGAIKSQASLVFEGEVTKIHHNVAPIGAGLYIEGYTGGAEVEGARTITYNLNQYMQIYDNVSTGYTYNDVYNPGQGAGVHLFFGPSMELEENSTIEVVMNGAIIEHNTADNGGGIYFENTSLASKNYTFNINLNYGSIQNNYATNGAGMYVSKGEVGSNNINNNTLTVSGNQSTQHGAGIYIIDGSLHMANGSITSNQSTERGNGGGIYIKNGNFTIEAGELGYNSVATGMGAGVYIEGSGDKGNFTMNGGAIKNNSSYNNTGGGVYVDGGNFILNNGSIQSNDSGLDGGGVYVNGGNFTLYNGSIQSNNSGQDGGGVYVNGGNFSLYNGSIIENVTTKDGGGVYVNGGNFTLDHSNGTISSNSSNANGGGVFLNNGNFDLILGEIKGNVSNQLGGGVYLKGEHCVYKLRNGNIEGNRTNADGGGVYLENGSFILAESVADIGTIKANTAGRGGGVFISSGGDFTMNGGQVINNSTTVNEGGGVYLGGGQFIQNNGTISGNYSMKNGGGVFLWGGGFTQNNGTINNNSSKENGGGVCIMNNGNFTMSNGFITGNGKRNSEVSTVNGGGVYLDGGALIVSAGSISQNTSKQDGGGVYIMNGTVNMGAGKIQTNVSGQYGGGVYVYNSSSADKKTVNFSGGTLEGNSAKYGGGVCVNGYIDLTIGNVEIAENSASNGGGVCLMNNAYMVFGAGQIKNNLALKDPNSEFYTNTTAYHKDITEVEGMGGGVYLNSNTTLIFNSVSNLGLFGNLADNGADELFANGNGTTVNIPDVTHMKLDGYPGAGNLKWIEDYTTNDTNYDKGTKLIGDVWDTYKTNMRYRDMLTQNMQNIPQLMTGIDANDPRAQGYISFALGYEILYITLIKYGLQRGESAIFNFDHSGSNSFKVIVTGDGSEYITKKVTVTAGEWTITEQNWGYTYTVTDSEGTELPLRKITKDIADEQNRTFIFKNVKKSAQTLPLNHESVIENIMGL